MHMQGACVHAHMTIRERYYRDRFGALVVLKLSEHLKTVPLLMNRYEFGHDREVL